MYPKFSITRKVKKVENSATMKSFQREPIQLTLEFVGFKKEC